MRAHLLKFDAVLIAFVTMTPANKSTLLNRLADALPLGSRFEIHHLSSPPTPCNAIFCAPPAETPEKTFCESHFLSVCIKPNDLLLQVFALEVLIYTTERLTTLFVSKADSTGYIHLLNLPKGTPSPLKTISSTFLLHLIETRQRSDRKLVLSLFARAQDQYLFPGSVENPGKHVLDDRGLVRWWCQVADPILHRFPSQPELFRPDSGPAFPRKTTYTSRGYLQVPGCDVHETRSFIPRQVLQSSQPNKWLVADPLRDIAKSPNLPVTCLIPRFPDDPKARFVDELDLEIREPFSQTQTSPSKGRFPGQWKSVRSIEQFWEMMAFRQECSSGRLVGFLWGVLTPNSRGKVKTINGPLTAPSGLQSNLAPPYSLKPPEADLVCRDSESPSSSSPTKWPSLPSPISSQEPEQPIASSPSSSSREHRVKNQISTGPVPRNERRHLVPPERTRHYYWPTVARGEVVLRAKDYQRVDNLLIHLDYSNEGMTAKSTKRWINDVAVAGRVEKWGHTVEGRKPMSTTVILDDVSVPILDTSLMRKKKRRNDDEINYGEATAQHTGSKGIEGPAINILPLGLIRKKPKIAIDGFGQGL